MVPLAPGCEARTLAFPSFFKSRWIPRLRPISQASVGRWREPEHAAAVQALMSDPRAVSLMDHYGYLEPPSTEQAPAG